MRGLTEDSCTKRKRLCYYSTDGMYLVADSVAEKASLVMAIGGDELGEMSVELSRTEAEELARFILAGVAR
ncbi:hypothetical protein [Stutzerimonas kirkiae]|uniref:hypothetical protein n=1 Tax=Stutzerimonas kirkiae TaxID=2211392 RepID=UPI0010385986|nr:hypothetical protein [Stutzerimonas kirkiae]